MTTNRSSDDRPEGRTSSMEPLPRHPSIDIDNRLMRERHEMHEARDSAAKEPAITAVEVVIILMWCVFLVAVLEWHAP